MKKFLGVIVYLICMVIIVLLANIGAFTAIIALFGHPKELSYLQVDYYSNQDRNIFVKHVCSNHYDCIAIADSFDVLRAADWNGKSIMGSDKVMVIDNLPRENERLITVDFNGNILNVGYLCGALVIRYSNLFIGDTFSGMFRHTFTDVSIIMKDLGENSKF